MKQQEREAAVVHQEKYVGGKIVSEKRKINTAFLVDEDGVFTCSFF